jgi:CRP/FNR family transcriptional regulator, dissimilatory nitrate respiration regulator
MTSTLAHGWVIPYDLDHMKQSEMNAGAGHRPDARAHLRHLRAGEALFRQGDPAEAIFRLESGQVHLLRHTEDGASVVMHVARPGETFAEAALFADAYHCDAIAQTPSRVRVIRKRDLLRDVRRDASAVLELARVLAGQVRDLRSRLEIRNIRAADMRLLAWLRLKAQGNPPSVELDRTWTQVAQEIGLTREATYRAVAAMRREGRIRIEGRMVRLA